MLAVLAVEGCTGWRFIIEECRAAGVDVQLAEPADTASADGPKHRAKTDRTDARKIRELLADGRLPQSWIPPQQVLEMRTLLRLYKDLRDEHTAWVQRIHGTLFYHGVPAPAGNLLGDDQRARPVAGDGLSPAAHQAARTALRTLDALDGEMTPLRRQLGTFARRQPGCAALLQHYGIGTVTAVAIWAELGDARRFSSSRQAVRHAGLEVTVYSSDNKRAPAASPGRVHHCCAGRCSKRPNARPGPAPPTTPTTSRSRLGAAATGPRCRWPANSCAGPPARTGGGRHSPRPDVSRRPPAASCRLTASKTEGPHPASPTP